MSRTAAQLLEKVEEAIYQIAAGMAEEKTITIGNEQKTFKAIDLDKLRQLRKELKSEIQDGEDGMFSNAQFAPFGRFS